GLVGRGGRAGGPAGAAGAGAARLRAAEQAAQPAGVLRDPAEDALVAAGGRRRCAVGGLAALVGGGAGGLRAVGASGAAGAAAVAGRGGADGAGEPLGTALTAAVPGGRRGAVLLLDGLGAAAQPGLARPEGGLLGRGQVLGGGALGLAGRTGGVGGGVRGHGGGGVGGGGRRGGLLPGGAGGRLRRGGLRLGGRFRPCTGGGLLGRAPGRRGGVRTLRRGAFPARPRGRGTGGRGRRGSAGVGRVLGGLLLSDPGGLPPRGGSRVRGTPGGDLPGRALGRFGGGVRALRRGR